MRRWGYVAAAALAVAGAVGTFPAADAAQPDRVHAAGRPALSGGGTTTPPIAFYPQGNGQTDVITTFGANQTVTVTPLTYTGEQLGSAIAPDGSAALLAALDSIDVLTQLNNPPVVQHTIAISRYDGEGSKKFVASATSVAINNDTALAAVNEQGIVQLRKTDAGWTIDKRVKIASSKPDDTKKAAGFIPIPRGKAKHALEFSSVLLSPVRTAKDHYIAFALDRTHHILQVIGHIGTAHPKILGRITDPSIQPLRGAADQFGDGAAAFSPATASRAVVGTPSGAAVLNLSNASHPKLHTKSTPPADPESQISDLAVSPDGDTVAVAAGNGMTTYSGLLTHKSLTFESVSEYVGTGELQSLAFQSDGSLAVQRVAVVNNEDRSYFDIDGTTPDANQEAQLTTIGVPNALSVAPGPFPVHFGDRTKFKVAAGHSADIPIGVANGVGSYDFSVYAGHLPKGLHIHKDDIVGKTSDTGKHSVTIRALNQFGGAAFTHLHIHVHHS